MQLYWIWVPTRITLHAFFLDGVLYEIINKAKVYLCPLKLNLMILVNDLSIYKYVRMSYSSKFWIQKRVFILISILCHVTHLPPPQPSEPQLPLQIQTNVCSGYYSGSPIFLSILFLKVIYCGHSHSFSCRSAYTILLHIVIISVKSVQRKLFSTRNWAHSSKWTVKL